MLVGARRLTGEGEKIVQQILRFRVIKTRYPVGVPANEKRLAAGNRMGFYQWTQRCALVVIALRSASLDNVPDLGL
jgi:hypothetical protein